MGIYVHFLLQVLDVEFVRLPNLEGSSSSLIVDRWAMDVSMGRLNTCPFLTSFFCIISLLILFWSYASTPDANSAPGVVRVSSSSIELDDSDSDSDSFVFFFLVGLVCTLF